MASGIPPEELEKLRSDDESIRESMLTILLLWSSVESEFVRLLSCFTRDEPKNYEFSIASVVIGATISADAQIAIIDRLVSSRIRDTIEWHNHGTPQVCRIHLGKGWGGLVRRLKKKKAVRNDVAHGCLVTSSEHGIILTHSFHVTKKDKPRFSDFKKAHDLKDTVKSLQEDFSLLHHFTSFLVERTRTDLYPSIDVLSDGYRNTHDELMNALLAGPTNCKI